MIRLLLIIVFMLSGCATGAQKHTYSVLPPYQTLSSSVDENVPSEGLTSFDPVPIDEGVCVMKEETVKVKPGILFSELGAAKAANYQLLSKDYKSLFNTCETIRKTNYSYFQEAEKAYQKEIERIKPGFFKEHAFELLPPCT